MGIVYKAHDIRLERDVVPASSEDRFVIGSLEEFDSVSVQDESEER
jgi:hypothetical protein